MIHKPIDKITKADIESLMSTKERESRTLEYKLKLPGPSDDDRREFLADVSAFANAAGGDILYGISESEGEPDGIPGLSKIDVDKEKLRLGEMIRSGIHPRINGFHIQELPGFENQVLLLRIPQSLNAPHMVTYKNLSRFFTRNSSGKHQLDVTEIRNAFELSGTVIQRLQNFRAERLAKIVAGETPVDMPADPKLILQIVPLNSFRLNSYIDATLQNTILQRLQPIHAADFHRRHNLDGYIISSHGFAGPKFDTYCQFHRNGTVESVYARLVVLHGERRDIAPIHVETNVLHQIKQYLDGLRQIGVPLPLFVMLSMTGVKGIPFIQSEWAIQIEPTPIDRDTVLLPDVLVESYDVEIEQLMQPVFDAMWNAAGFERCLNYDDKGKYKRSR
jgi:hypothetical protein